jgi:hypothetical protein
LDDSPGEEIALLLMMMAMIAPAATVAAAPQQKAEAQSCRAEIILISKAIEPRPERHEQAILPQGKAGAKGPAVLMPACKPNEGKKKDYPMA